MFSRLRTNKHKELSKKNIPTTSTNLNNPDEQKPNYAGVAAIAMMMFTLGIAWYIPGGIAYPLINTFHSQGVTLNVVNLSLTIYLVGLMGGALLVPLVFFKFRRKFIIVGAAINYLICNLIVAFSVNWGELLAFRFLCGLSHGCCTAVATLMAAYMVPKNKKGVAIAICYSALFASTFTVVPLLTYTSGLDHWGIQNYNVFLAAVHHVVNPSQNMAHQLWRWSFVTTCGFCLIAIFMLCFTIPNSMRIPGKINIKKAVGTLGWWPFLLSLLFCIIIFLGIFIIYPLLQELWQSNSLGILSGFKGKNADAEKASLIAVLLLVYGICSTIGNQMGGLFTKGKTFPWVYIITLLFILDVVLLTISCAFKSPIAVLIFTLLLPVVAYLALPNLYVISLALARHHDKTESVDFESGVLSVAIGLGGMIGTAVGGPITANVSGEFVPQKFVIICYIVIASLAAGLILLIPLQWYIRSAGLSFSRTIIIDAMLRRMPIYLDKYSNPQMAETVLSHGIAKDQYNNTWQIDQKVKIIDRRNAGILKRQNKKNSN